MKDLEQRERDCLSIVNGAASKMIQALIGICENRAQWHRDRNEEALARSWDHAGKTLRKLDDGYFQIDD